LLKFRDEQLRKFSVFLIRFNASVLSGCGIV